MDLMSFWDWMLLQTSDWWRGTDDFTRIAYGFMLWVVLVLILSCALMEWNQMKSRLMKPRSLPRKGRARKHSPK